MSQLEMNYLMCIIMWLVRKLGIRSSIRFKDLKTEFGLHIICAFHLHISGEKSKGEHEKNFFSLFSSYTNIMHCLSQTYVSVLLKCILQL